MVMLAPDHLEQTPQGMEMRPRNAPALPLPGLAEVLAGPRPAAPQVADQAGVLHLDGLGLIEAVHGRETARAVRDQAVAIAKRGGGLEVGLAGEDRLILRRSDGRALAVSRIAAIAARISLTPLETGDGTLVVTAAPLPSGVAVRLSAPVELVETARARARLAGLGKAAGLLGLAGGADLDLRWVAVTRLGGEGPALYYRMILADGALDLHEPGGQPHPLACAAEFTMVGLALSELAQQPDLCISVPLSGAWLGAPGWQAALIERLRQAGETASRLILALTAERGAAGNWTTLSARLRQCGSAICVAQFGVAAMPVSDVMAMAPDVIEVSGRLVAGALRSDRFAASLPPLVTLARSLAPILVAGGVDCADSADLAAASRLDWGWGDALRAASIGRPWRLLRLVTD